MIFEQNFQKRSVKGMINEQNLSNMDIEEELTDLENAKDIIEEVFNKL